MKLALLPVWTAFVADFIRLACEVIINGRVVESHFWECCLHVHCFFGSAAGLSVFVGDCMAGRLTA